MSSKVNNLLHRRAASSLDLNELPTGSDPWRNYSDSDIKIKGKARESIERIIIRDAIVDAKIPLENWKICVDIIVVQKALINQVDRRDLGFVIDHYDDAMIADNLLATYQFFDEWLEKHKKVVESLDRLDLSNLKLKHLPRSINKFTAIEYLNLRLNRFETVSSNITTMRSLIFLGLSDNKIRELPSWIGRLKNLKTLHLSGNELKTLPEEIIGLTNLTKIDLRDNKFKAVPEVLYKMKKEHGNDKKLDGCLMSGRQRGPWPVESIEEEEAEEVPDLTTIDGKSVKEIKDRSFCSTSFQNLAIGTIMSVGLLVFSIAWTRNIDNITVLGE